MKTGLILLVTNHDLNEEQASAPVQDFSPDEVRLATSEIEAAYGWWELLARGAGRVQAVRARWDDHQQSWTPTSAPLHVCG
jgi:hypothetical protein